MSTINLDDAGEVLGLAVIHCGAEVTYQNNDRGDQWTDFTFTQDELLEFVQRVREIAVRPWTAA